MMITENYEKLSPNAKMLALRKEKQKIEERIRELKERYTECECGYLFDINAVKCGLEEKIQKERFSSLCEFDDDEYRDVKYIDTVYYCPVCGKKYIHDHFMASIQ